MMMFIPTDYVETDPNRLHEFIERNSFGLLVSQFARQPFATHIPFLLDRTSGPHGTLIGHLARANPQWQDITGQTTLAVFSGPHAYISPTWYEAEKVVPTWNYTAVHAYGPVEIIEDKQTLLDILLKSVEVYERALPQPWSFDPASTFVERLMLQIVGFRIKIERLEGKFKLNQNHPAERCARVVRALQQQGDENSLGVATLMQDMLSAKA